MDDLSLAIARSLQDTNRQTWDLPENLDEQRAKKDIELYRKGYPGQFDDPSLSKNLAFYKGYISCFPDGDTIDNIHKKWFGNYEKLEKHHGYIQWLFPIRETGGNKHVHPLQLHEALKIKNDPETAKRVLLSYKMMLNFFGIRFKNGCDTTGELERATNWKSRYHELNVKWNHNFLRITRILKCLGEVGYEAPYKKNFLLYIFREIFEFNQLKNTLNALETYWIQTLKDDNDRVELEQLVTVYKEK